MIYTYDVHTWCVFGVYFVYRYTVYVYIPCVWFVWLPSVSLSLWYEGIKVYKVLICYVYMWDIFAWHVNISCMHVDYMCMRY